MKEYNWNNEKNQKLIIERMISFEEVVFYISQGHVIEIIENPNKEKYKNQKAFVININDYIHYVPFVEKENEIFLKTIIPSRKLTKKYLRGKKWKRN